MFAILLYHLFVDKSDISQLIQAYKPMLYLSNCITADG